MPSDGRTTHARVGAWDIGAPPMRHETHCCDRVVRCFASRPHSLFEMFQEAVRCNPAGEALVSGRSRITWGDLDRHVAQRAAALAGCGVRSGDRVVLLLRNGLEFPMVLIAAARIGAIAVPLSYRSKSPEVCYIINQCGAAAIVFDTVLASELPAADNVPTLKSRISVDDWPSSEYADPSQASLDTQVSEDDVALLMYTSGTTGHPKGALVTHVNLIHAALVYEYCMDLTMRDRSLIAVPMSHITGIAALVAPVIRCASTLVVMESFKATAFLALAAAEAVTHTVMAPAMYNLCLLAPDFGCYDLAAWRIGGYGGAPMGSTAIAGLAERLPNLSLMNCYGATETVVALAIMPAGETPAHPDRVGRAVPGADIVVMDEQGQEARTGMPGELWMRGPSVVSGYWDNPEATHANFTGGFWHSGDIGSVTATGLVGIHDRKKDMINRGGYKVFAVEVENVLCTHPSVIEAAVVAKPCPVLGQRVHAFVTQRSEPATAEDLKAFCAERLSDYKVPETFTLLEQPLPRNANGKVLKRELREQLQDLVSVQGARESHSS